MFDIKYLKTGIVFHMQNSHKKVIGLETEDGYSCNPFRPHIYSAFYLFLGAAISYGYYDSIYSYYFNLLKKRAISSLSKVLLNMQE